MRSCVASVLLVISLVLTAVSTAGLQGATTLLNVQPGPVTSTISVLWQLMVTLAVNTLIFALVFKYLPDTQMAWHDVQAGAFISAVVWGNHEAGVGVLHRLEQLQQCVWGDQFATGGDDLDLFQQPDPGRGAEFTKVYARRYDSRGTTTAAREAR